MNTSSFCLRVLRPAISTAVLLLVATASAQIQSAVWHSKTNGPAGQLTAFFPKPNTVTGSPELLVVPLLGSQHRLLPNGRLRVWVGRSDGTSLAGITVTLRVPESGNALVADNTRATEVTVQTDGYGIAEVRFAAPDVPPSSMEEDGSGNGPPVL